MGRGNIWSSDRNTNYSNNEILGYTTILLTLVSEPKTVFLSSLISVLAIFNIGMINFCGCLLLMLCNTSKCSRAQLISQRVDTGQLNLPPQQ